MEHDVAGGQEGSDEQSLIKPDAVTELDGM